MATEPPEQEDPKEKPEGADDAAERAEDAAAEGPEETSGERAEVADDAAERAEDAATEGPQEGGEQQAEPEQVAEAPAAEGEQAKAAQPPAPAEERARRSDLPPGADLDPITLEPKAQLSAEERARLEAEAEERARLEAEATAEAREEEPAPASRAPAELNESARYLATGKRKRSVARVTVTPGNGEFSVNKRQLDAYFPRPAHQTMVKQPLSISGYEGSVDVRVRVHGGGISGQAGAVRHGLARALTEIDPQLRQDLKRRGFLSRDARAKERRKAGLKKARKRPQFSKR